MRIKDECEFSISGRNKKRILLGVVILSIAAMLTPVSLAATAGISVNKITDQSANTDKITAPLLNTASSASILSILDKGETTDQSANNVGTEIAGGSTVDTSGDSSNSAATNDIINTASGVNNNVIVNTAVGGSSTSGTGGSSSSNNQPQSASSNNVNQLTTSGGTEHKSPSFKFKKGDILIWDAGKRYKLQDLDLKNLTATLTKLAMLATPGSLNGHAAIVVDVQEGKGENGMKDYVRCVEAVPNAGVRYFTFGLSDYVGSVYFAVGRVKDNNGNYLDTTTLDRVTDWACSRVGDKYQEFWHLCTVGAGKWMNKFLDKYSGADKVKQEWYCSELVWAAYYYNCYTTYQYPTEIYDYLLNTFDTHVSFEKTEGLTQTQRDGLESDAKNTIDIDNDGWSLNTKSELYDFLINNGVKWLYPSVSPLEIYMDNNVEIVYTNGDAPPKDGSTTCAIERVDDGDTNINADINTNVNVVNPTNNAVSSSQSNAANSLSFNSVSSSNTLTSLSLSLNANTLLSYLLKIPRSH